MARPVANPPNPWHSSQIEWLGPPPDVALEIYETEARSILSKNDSPDLGFTYSVNPYQGCYHGCAYCYARPTHQYLGHGAGTDFERKLMVKTNAAELLRAALNRPSWKGEGIVFSGNTDCYQPLEASYQLTRRCLEVCLEFQNPITIISKGGVILRDVALLGELAERAGAQVFITIPFVDEDMRRKIEPYAAPIEKRFEALRQLSAAGVSTGVSLAPVIPGLNDSQMLQVLERARSAGATSAFMTLLRLPAEVKDVFFERLSQGFPDRVDKVRNGLVEMRGGVLNDPRFGSRMEGSGQRWAMLQQMFELQCKRLGMNAREDTGVMAGTRFKRPTRQLALF